MADYLSAVIDTVDYGFEGQGALRDLTVSPAGVGSLGTADLLIIKEAGGFTILPMRKVKLARKTNATTFNPRLLYGIVAHLETSQWLGTLIKEWVVRCQDVNVLGKAIGTPLTFTYAPFTGDYAAQIAAIVAAVQGAYGGSPEAIDASTQVANLYGSFTMPRLEGGHPLDWYIEQINLEVYRLSSGVVSSAFFYGYDATAGTVFGSVLLYCYDALSLPASGASYSTTPTGAQRAIRAWKRTLDSTTLYVRRDAIYEGGSVTGYSSAANTTYPCPWSAGGWWAPPAKYDTAVAATAQALIDGDVAANCNALETVVILTDRAIHTPGDVIDLEIDLEGIPAGTKYRVVRTRTVFEARIADYDLTEITCGLLPRGLGRHGGQVPGAPILRDVVPPDPPASAPTIQSNTYSDVTGTVTLVLRLVNSVSMDVGAHRIRYTVGGGEVRQTEWIDAAGPGPLTTDFVIAGLPPSTAFTAAGQARDTSLNVQPTLGPTLASTTAAPDAPAAPTGISAKYGTVDDGPMGGYAKFSFTPSGYARIGGYEWELWTTDAGRLWYNYGTLGATATGFSVQPLPVNRALRLIIRTVSIGGLRGPDSTPFNFTIGVVPLPTLPDYEDKEPTATDPDLTIAGWTATLTGDGTFAVSTPPTGSGGTRGPLLGVTTGTAQLESEHPQGVQEGGVYTAGFVHDATVSTGTLLSTIRWHNTAGVFLSASNVYNAPPSTSSPLTEVQVTAPAGAALAYWRNLLTGSGSATALKIGPVRLSKSAGTKDIVPNAIIDTLLDPTTVKNSPSWVAWNIEAAPLLYKDGGGTTIGITTYDNTGSGALQISAPQTDEKIKFFAAAGVTTLELSSTGATFNGDVSANRLITTANANIGTSVTAGGNITVGNGTNSGTVQNTGSGGAAELLLKMSGDEYGGTELYLHNRNGENGVILFGNMTDSSISLLDFIMRYRTAGGNVQRNIRIEGRGGGLVFSGGNPEFQFGNPGDPDVGISSGGLIVRRGTLQLHASSALIADIDSNARLAFRKNTGANVGIRRRANFIDDAHLTWTLVDVALGEEVTITPVFVNTAFLDTAQTYTKARTVKPDTDAGIPVTAQQNSATHTGRMFKATDPAGTTEHWAIDAWGKHISGGTAPAIAAGTGAGSSPTISITGTDTAGYITLTTGSTPTLNGDICTVTFWKAFGATPRSITISEGNANAANHITRRYVDQATVSTTIWRLKNGNTALAASTQYIWYYHVNG